MFFPDFWKLSRLSGNFPDCPETFQTVRKLSRLSGSSPDCPEAFQTVRKSSRLSGNFSDSLETYSLLTWCLGFILWPLFKVRAKTFRTRKNFPVLMPTRQRSFWDFGHTFEFPFPLNIYVGLGFWVVPSSHMLKTEFPCHFCGKEFSGATIRDIGYQLDSQWDLSHPTFNLSLIV